MASKGILGVKLGMTQVFDEENRVVPVTVVQAGPCTVTQVKTVDTDGYTAVQLAYGSRKNVNKPIKGHLSKADLESARVLAELRLEDGTDLPELGSQVTVETFAAGDEIDVTGTSKGKGYAGVMKRHNFHGMGDGHGVKKKNRHPGSVGNASTPGRTFKGTRMAGRMGGDRVTMQNLQVVDIDVEHSLILVKGALPGSNGSVVFIKDAVKAANTASGSGAADPAGEKDGEA
jgi:large subunit ribosomal protein L3